MKRMCFSMGMLAVSMWAAATVQAGGHHSAGSYGSAGSSGGSYGSYGSSGGSYGSSGGAVVLAGSHGSSGGSSGGLHAQKKLDRLIYKAEKQAASHGSSGGSYGSHGSSGGSYGSVGSAGSYGSSGSSGGVSHKLLRKIDRAAEKVIRKSQSHGSSGGYSSHGSAGSYGSSGASYGQLHSSVDPVYASPVAVTRPVVTAPAAPEFAYVVVQVPADATLYLGGNRTSTTGAVRKFKVPVTDASRSYPYTVRAELTRNGQVYVAQSTETLVAGETLTVRVNDVAAADVPVAAR